MTLPLAAAAVMSTPGAVTSGLMAPSPTRGPVAGEVGEQVLVVDGADGERGVGAARANRSDCRALVAGRDGEQDALLGGELVDRRLHRVDLGGVRAAQAQVDDVGALLGRPLHAGDDAGVVAVARVVEDLAVEELRAGRDALVLAAGLGAGAGRDGRDVRAVADLVAGGRARR